LRVRVSQQNASGTLDTVIQRLIINVTDEYKILQMFNYPNPFGAETWFTFVVTGNTPPEELTLRIYTVKGRKIREIRSGPGSLQVGFNRVYWDGRDTQGDEVANGNYLYQVQITGGGKSLTATGKAARVR
jgi:flagellar hook assembly protein FlgD